MPSPGLPHLVVDDEHPVVAVGRQPAPRVALSGSPVRAPWPPATRTTRTRCRRRRRRSPPSPRSAVPISMYGLSVNRCDAGRSTPTSAQHAAREVGRPVDPHRVVGQLHHGRLEVRRVVVGAGLRRERVEAVDEPVGRIGARRRSPDQPQVVLPRCPGRAGEHRRGDRRQRRIQFRRQRLRSQDQIRGRRHGSRTGRGRTWSRRRAGRG